MCPPGTTRLFVPATGTPELQFWPAAQDACSRPLLPRKKTSRLSAVSATAEMGLPGTPAPSLVIGVLLHVCPAFDVQTFRALPCASTKKRSIWLAMREM